MNNIEMRVIKRNGSSEDLSFDKILNRIKTLGLEDNIHINYQSLVMKVIEQLYNNISTSEIDELAAQQWFLWVGQRHCLASSFSFVAV